MSTTTVRLDPQDEEILDRLASTFGGRSNAIRQALRSLVVDVERHQALADFLAEWEAEVGPVDIEAVDAMANKYGL
jgi:predicted transcriptional regulator